MSYTVAIHQGSGESGPDLDSALGDLPAWIAADRGPSTTLIQAATAALEAP
jgi:hypothetical protein